MQTWRVPVVDKSARSEASGDAHDALWRVFAQTGNFAFAAARLWVFAVLAAVMMPTSAATLEVHVSDGTQTLGGVVVSLHSDAAKTALNPAQASMEQVKSEFTPRVVVVDVGSTVTFPNRDKTRHHVYSFSPAKRFELPLHDASAAAPVTFDAPGIVTVGCNIHDWMVGYVVVSDTPYSGVTDEHGVATIEVPSGRYQLHVWHERQTETAATVERDIEVLAADNAVVQITLTLPPAALLRGDDRIRAAQEKLRQRRRDGN